MSMADTSWGDFGLSEASAIKKRQRRSIANQQSAFYGQQRGQRRLADIRRQYSEGFQPKMAEYGTRGLAGPNVQSGIQRKGLERYAASLQEDLGAESMTIQEELNRIAMDESSEQADLEDYINDLRAAKQREIISAATQLRQFGSYF
jgi:hypothetical protein